MENLVEIHRVRLGSDITVTILETNTLEKSTHENTQRGAQFIPEW